MRPYGIGLIAALVIAALAPAAVLSAPKKAEDITPAARTQGMAEAPAIAQAAGIACKVTDARLVGKAEDKKAKTTTSYYEIDCDQGVGFILQSVTGAPKPTAFSCIEANSPQPDGKPSSLPCKLPGNADPKADLGPVLAKAGLSCVPTNTRGIGQSATSTFVEVACQDGQGYVLQTSAPMDPAKPVEANNCLIYDEANGNIKCTLTAKESRLAVVDTYSAAAKNNCAIKDRRYVGVSQAGSTFFEVSCADGKGYLYKVDKGALAESYPCAKAAMVMGGCTLTDAREAQTEEAAFYTKGAKKAGYDCDVVKYAPFPAATGKEVVEMACGNRPDGAVGIFGGPTDTTLIYDCARAPIAGYRCSFSKPETGYKAVTADLKALGKDQCNVSNVRVVGKTAKGTTFLETTCTGAEGKGYIIEYTAEPLKAIGAINCAFSKDCKLPGNT
jgi:hypothetical protein